MRHSHPWPGTVPWPFKARIPHPSVPWPFKARIGKIGKIGKIGRIIRIVRIVRIIGIALAALLLAGCQSATPGGAQAGGGASYTLTYAAVGASDAFGVGTDDPATQSWPSVLAGLLSAHTHLLNLGIPQATAAVALATEVPIAAQAGPGIVTVWLGVNDYEQQVPLATFAAQMRTMLATLAGTGARVYVGNLPDLTLLPFFDDHDPAQLRADVAAWNAAIAGDAAATGAHLVDIFTGFGVVASQPDLLSADGLHPSVLGARLLADVFAAAIQNG